MVVAPRLNEAMRPLRELLKVHLPVGMEPVPEVDWSLGKLIVAGGLVGFGSKVSCYAHSDQYLKLIR